MALETLKDVKEISGYKLYDIDEASRLATLGDLASGTENKRPRSPGSGGNK